MIILPHNLNKFSMYFSVKLIWFDETRCTACHLLTTLKNPKATPSGHFFVIFANTAYSLIDALGR